MRNVVMPLMSLDEFTGEQAKQHCSEASPNYVTKLVNSLVRDAYIQPIEIDGSERYRWTDRRSSFQPDLWIDSQINGVQVKRRPEKQRPRERLYQRGAANLDDGELLAILIRSGIVGESAVIGGEKLGDHFHGRLAELPTASLEDVRKITKSVNVANYAQIMAGIELGRRVAMAEGSKVHRLTRITSTAEAIAYCQLEFARLLHGAKQEEFHIVTLDTKHQPITSHQITVGTLDASLVHPREVFKPAIRDSASAVLLVHNHPSGDPSPSREDHQVTDRLTQAGKLLGIEVLDHIIVARQRCVSLREES